MKLNKNKTLTTIIFLLIAVFLVLLWLNKKNIIAKKISNLNLNFISETLEVKKENEKLKKTNREYTTKSELINFSKNENNDLKDMEQFKKKNPNYQLIACNISKKDMDSSSTTYIANKGSKDGLSKNMIVVTAEGLFGKISSVNDNYSTIESIENNDVVICAIIEKNKNTIGIVRGVSKTYDKRNILQMSINSIDKNIKPKYLVTTYGIGDLIPSGIKIGHVVNQQADTGNLNTTITIKPCLNLNTIDKVFVIVYQDKEKEKYTGGEIKY